MKKQTSTTAHHKHAGERDHGRAAKASRPLSIMDVLRLQVEGHELQQSNGLPVGRMSFGSSRRAPPLCSSRMRLGTVAPGYDGRLWIIRGGDSGKRWTHIPVMDRTGTLHSNCATSPHLYDQFRLLKRTMEAPSVTPSVARKVREANTTIQRVCYSSNDKLEAETLTQQILKKPLVPEPPPTVASNDCKTYQPPGATAPAYEVLEYIAYERKPISEKDIEQARYVYNALREVCTDTNIVHAAYGLLMKAYDIFNAQFIQGGHGSTVHRHVDGPRKTIGKKADGKRANGKKTNGARRKTKKRKRVVGPNNCCVCDDPLPAFGPGSVHEPLIPRACYMTHGRSHAHRMCRECWFHGKHGRPAFASEDAVHGCPGCIAGKPFPPMLPAVGPPTAAFDLS